MLCMQLKQPVMLQMQYVNLKSSIQLYFLCIGGKHEIHQYVRARTFPSDWSYLFLCSGQYGCYKEIYRVLKPGQYFAAYEWCMTDAFDPNNQEHQKIKVIYLRRIKKNVLVTLYVWLD